jgi:hypothetical protein
MKRKRDRRVTRALATLTIVPLAFGVWAATNGCSDDAFTSGQPDAATDATTTDVSTGTDASSDAIVPFDGGACDLSKKFGSLQPLSNLNTSTASEQTARLTHDELNIYYQQKAVDGGTLPDGGPARAYFQIMTASRPAIGAAWGTPQVVTGISLGAADETDPTVTAENEILYFDSPQVDASTPNSDIWVSSRTLPQDFSAPIDQGPFNTAADESQPYLSANGLALYFRTRAPASSNFDIARATRPTTGTFTVDTSNIFTNINSPSSLEGLPVISFDELTLYFTTDRSEAGAGGRQVWKATRTKLTDPFGSPTEVTELDTTAFTEPSWISDDGCRIYITSTAAGTADLYAATRPAN